MTKTTATADRAMRLLSDISAAYHSGDDAALYAAVNASDNYQQDARAIYEELKAEYARIQPIEECEGQVQS